MRAATLRITLLGHLAPLAADLILTGQNQSDVGVMIFLNCEASTEFGYNVCGKDKFLKNSKLLGEIKTRLMDWNRKITRSSNQIAHAAILAEPSLLADTEITAKEISISRKSDIGRMRA